jgi:DUF971 family protein
VKIKRFTLNNSQSKLTIAFSQGQIFELSFEYLRVFSPQTIKSKTATIETHKKQVQLIAIEAVGKHGYRFIFDDGYSGIYSFSYLETLAKEQEQHWQQYLAQLKTCGHSREAMIDIKQL